MKTLQIALVAVWYFIRNLTYIVGGLTALFWLIWQFGKLIEKMPDTLYLYLMGFGVASYLIYILWILARATWQEAKEFVNRKKE